MNVLINGVTAMANGALTALHDLASPACIAMVVAGVSLAWLARIEVDEMDRQATKPTIDTH